MRPYGVFYSLWYAVKAAYYHYRFARKCHWQDKFFDGTTLVVQTRHPTQEEMNVLGAKYCDFSRMDGKQPLDPEEIWRDIALLWSAFHYRRPK